MREKEFYLSEWGLIRSTGRLKYPRFGKEREKKRKTQQEYNIEPPKISSMFVCVGP